MTLAVWKPRGNRQNCARKGYTADRKEKRDWSYFWDCEGGIKNGDASIEKIGRLRSSIRDKNLNVCFGNAFPLKNEPFRRRYDELEDVGTDILYLDFDKEDARVSSDTPLLERIEYSLSALPIPQNVGLVAYYSSSAYWGETKPERVSVHCIIILDKVYPHPHIRAWQKQFDCLDPATALRSQPLLIANPEFCGTQPRQIVGNELLIRPGKTLNIDKIDLEIANKRPIPLNKRLLVISQDVEDWKNQVVAKAEAGKLDGERHNFIFNTFHTKIFHEREKVDEYLKVFEDNPILYSNPNDKREFKDVVNTRLRAQEYVDVRLLGKPIEKNKNFKVKTVHTATLGKEHIDDYPTENALIMVKSPPNTRKTTGIIDEYIEKGGFKSAIFLSPNKAQLEAFVHRDSPINWRMYNEMGNSVAEKMNWMPRQEWLASTDQSIGYFFAEDLNGEVHYPRDVPPELIVFEESEACAMNIINPRSQRNAPLIYGMCDKARAILMLDADETDDVTGYLGQSLANRSGKEAHLLVNTFSWNKDKQIQLLNSEAQAILTIKALLDAGDRVFCHVGYNNEDEKKRMTAIAEHFRKYLGFDEAVKWFSATTATTELRREPNKVIQNWFEGGLRLMINSPWSIRSWDYNPRHPKAIHFDANVGIYPKNNISPVNINQQDWRMRQTRRSFIYITQERDYKQFESTKRVMDKAGEIVKSGELSHDMYIRAKNRNNDSKSNVRDAYRLLVEENGLGATVKTDFIEEPWHNEYEKSIKNLLSEHGLAAFEEECLEIWQTPHKREEVLSNFFDMGRAEREFDGEIQPIALNRDDVNFEEFTSLYKRYLKVTPSEVRDIIAFWKMSEEQRKYFDGKELAHCAVVKGIYADAIDRELRDFYPKGINIFPEIVVLDEKTRSLTFTPEAVKRIGDVIKSYYDGAHGEIPWLKRTHKSNFLSFIEDMFDYFEIEWERTDKSNGVVLKKAAVLKEYVRLGEIDKRDGQKRNLEIVNSRINRKMREGRRLSYSEYQWQLARGTNYILSFPDFRSLAIYRAVKEDVCYA